MTRYLDGIDGVRGIEEPFPNELYATVDPGSVPRIVGHLQRQHGALACLFATDERPLGSGFKIHYTVAMPGDLFLTLVAPLKGEEFPSVTPILPAANWYEREVMSLFGLNPVGHPDPRGILHGMEGLSPLRKGDMGEPKGGDYPFRRVDGEGVFEIPVGPVHAGIIEPGHFRFSTAGENVLNLELRLFYTHKGVEKLFEGTEYERTPFLAERVSGDNSLAHSTALCQALERAAGAQAPERAAYIRTVLLEMERLYNHLGDIGGIATDVAFYFGAVHAARMREGLMAMNERLTGSRILHNVNRVGGVRVDITKEDSATLSSALGSFEKDFQELMDVLLGSSSFLDRVETTGRLTEGIARDLGVVGPPARASGLDRDVRRDHPYAAYPDLEFEVPVRKEGDVFARMMVKAEEVHQALRIIEQALEAMPGGPLAAEVEIPSGRRALGYAEGPRGETLYWVMTGEGKPYRCKVRDPSFCNWPAMEYAIQDNIVPDFPLINKSFNLSYSGNDG